MNAFTNLLDTLDDILTVLTTDAASGGCPLSLQPCRVALYPGGEVPFDSCEDTTCGDGGEGQLWANVQPVSSPSPYPAGSGCERFVFTAQIGITRCAAKPTLKAPPSVEAVRADATQQAIDADEIANAILCCDALDPDTRERLTLTGWTPIDPSGGCYGGVWSIQAVYDVCC